ncbi:unnamed protein product [Didymodactylos carnosus]|uniref:Uncharacterized protein n=1 Tax=Didymodactylos carnosus TaxID=1234261 RepID=A0A815KER6_9BILA|nr:unnamed protein product [Didymodactylos carnosus]CAF1394654.1 unnamed protein product [Didymodactylos carnosus]CAF3731296.1 unnamed protein product [Didymodactylos carnosus]CAF4288893.1 unnamed protein product [Didymodactylos carnosus]
MAKAGGSLSEGLYGTRFQWISIHASMFNDLYLNFTGGIIKDYYNFSQDFIGSQNLFYFNSDVYQRYVTRWRSAPYDLKVSTIHPKDTSTSISVIANFAYDACFMFANALHRISEVMHLNPIDEANREIYYHY